MALAVSLSLVHSFVYLYSVKLSAEGLHWWKWGRRYLAKWEDVAGLSWGQVFVVFRLYSGEEIQLNFYYHSVRRPEQVSAEFLEFVSQRLCGRQAALLASASASDVIAIDGPEKK